MTSQQTQPRDHAIAVVSGADGENGHLEEFRTDPVGLMQRVRDECGDVGAFDLANRRVVLLTGAEANEYFFRAPDEDLGQNEAYPFMTPIFGKGVVFDADPERRKEMLHNTALRGEHMKSHAATIEREVHTAIANWGETGEIDLLDFFAELTLYTSSACLIGTKFRNQIDARFPKLYHDLERGTDPLCYVDPYLPIESFRRRDEAREAIVGIVEEIKQKRIANPPKDKSDRDLMDVLVSVTDEDGMDADRDAASPRCLRRAADRARRALLRRSIGQLPRAAPNSAVGERHQGNAAAASTADHPDAHGAQRR
jgi:sterol 14-demethylase